MLAGVAVYGAQQFALWCLDLGGQNFERFVLWVRGLSQAMGYEPRTEKPVWGGSHGTDFVPWAFPGTQLFEPTAQERCRGYLTPVQTIPQCRVQTTPLPGAPSLLIWLI